jgi:hypothetical protein
VVFAQGPSYYAEEETMSEIYAVPTILETIITEQTKTSTSVIGTSTFTLTEVFTDRVSCSSLSYSSAPAIGSVTPAPVPIAECVGVQGLLLGDITPSATLSLSTYTQSMFGTPVTTVVFDAATLSQGSGNSNSSGRSQGVAPMGLQFSLFLTVMGVVLGGGMVLI